MGNLSDWQPVSETPLGRGGQSIVLLVRRPERTAKRQKALEKFFGFGAPYHSLEQSEEFAAAIAEAARKDYPSELAALKNFVPRADLGQGAEQSAIERLRNEIQVLKKAYQGFVQLLDSNVSERWIVTEYCANGTLETNLPTYKGNAQASLAALVPLIRAVANLHQEGIIHRDIKPQNIFVGQDGRLLLGDFGLVFLPDQAERVSATGESVGPRDFMPPWVFLGPQPAKINPQFDVYMLGKVLWCMISGSLKLHREDFLEDELNLTKLFPNNPQMHAINLILTKTVVTREKDCLGSALDLWLMAGKLLEMMQNGGQLLTPEIRRPCRACGVGQYFPEQKELNLDHPTVSMQLNRARGSMAERAGGFQMLTFTCDYCQHIQFFKVKEPATARP